MITATITLNGVTVKKPLPIDWPQVTFGQFLQIADCGRDFVKIISVFTGIDAETLTKAKITGLDRIISAMAFLETNVTVFDFPKEILGYKVPQNLEFETMGQYADFKSEVDKDKKDKLDSVKSYPLFCAIYTSNPYNFKQAEERAKEFLQAPCTEVMAIGNFLLMKLAALKINGLKGSLKANTPQTKSKRVLKNLVKRSGSIRLLSTLKKKRARKGKNS